MARRKSHISKQLSASDLTRLIEFMQPVYTEPDGEPKDNFTGILVTKARKIEHRVRLHDTLSNDFSISEMFFEVLYSEEYRTLSVNFEGLKIIEVIGTPVYLVGADTWGNLLIDTASTTYNEYEIMGFQEIGDRVGFRIQVQLWR